MNYPVGMRIIPVVLLIAYQVAGGLVVVSPPYPANAIRGGNVAAALQVSKGIVRNIAILYGDEPFIAPTRAALAQWKFPAAENGAALVIANFRDPYLVMSGSGQGISFSGRTDALKLASSRSDIPLPKEVSDPLYPGATLIIQGASVLHFQVTESGSIGAIETLQALGDCTQSTIDALKKWKFVPAVNAQGKKFASDAFAIFVYRPLNQR